MTRREFEFLKTVREALDEAIQGIFDPRDLKTLQDAKNGIDAIIFKYINAALMEGCA